MPRPMPARGRALPARASVMAPPASAGVTAPPAGAAPALGQGPSRGTMVPPPTGNKGFSSAPVAMAAGGPVLSRNISFAKDEFTGGRMPTKQSAPAKQDYGSKGGVAKRTGDKSLPAVKPRG